MTEKPGMVCSYWNSVMIIDIIQRDKNMRASCDHRVQLGYTSQNKVVLLKTCIHHGCKKRRQSKVCGLNKGLCCQKGQGGSRDIYHPADILPLSLLGRGICDSTWVVSPVWWTVLWQAVSHKQCVAGVGWAGGDKLCHFSQLPTLMRKASTAVRPLPFQSLHLHWAYDNQQLVSLINQHLLWP